MDNQVVHNFCESRLNNNNPQSYLIVIHLCL